MTNDDDHAGRSGALRGLHGAARTERHELVQWLLGSNFSAEQIEGSLVPVLLAANRVIGDDGTFISAREIAEAHGLPVDLITTLHDAAGLARVDESGETRHPRADAEAVLPAASLMQAGFDPESVAVIVRLLVDGLNRAAVAMRQAAMQALLHPGTTELQLAEALMALALHTEPMLDPMISGLARLAWRRSFETEAVNAAERAAGTLPGARPVAVAFADFVGFTRLGEAVPPQELVRLASQLAAATRGVVAPPVQFVKTIGDAVMLVSPNPGSLVNAVLSLLDAAAGDDLPPLRSGVAFGLAVSRAGDWYGSPVNVASRVTSIAPPGTVFLTKPLVDGLDTLDGVECTFAKNAQLRGLSEKIPLFRASRAP